MFNEHKYDRRRFLSSSAFSLASIELSMMGFANAKPGNINSANRINMKQTSNKSFDVIKQIDAGVLNVGYAEAGPPAGPVVILSHGWPYDIHSFVDVAPLLASAGYR